MLSALLPWLDPLPRPRPRPGQLARLVVAAATGSAGFNVLLVAASRQADPAAIGAVVGASPVVLAVLGAPRGRGGLPRPRAAVLLGAAGATAGVVVLQGSGRSTAAGLALAVGVLACEVSFTLVAAPLLPELGAARVSTWSCGLAAGLLAAASLATGEHLRPPTASEAGALVYQGVAATAFAFVVWYRGVERLGPDRAGVAMAAAPVAAAAVAVALGTARPTPGMPVGAALVAAGVAWAVRPARPADHAASRGISDPDGPLLHDGPAHVGSAVQGEP